MIMNKHLEIDPYNEEIWEEDDYKPLHRKLQYLKIEGEEFEVSMDEFVIENRRGRYGEPLPMYNVDNTITFKNPFDKEKFLEYFDYFKDYKRGYCGYSKDYKKNISIVVCDRKGLVIEKINLHGVLMTSISINENQVTIQCEYWEKMYI